MAENRKTVVGYTGVVISESEAGYTGAEGYTGVVKSSNYVGYTGSTTAQSGSKVAPVRSQDSDVQTATKSAEPTATTETGFTYKVLVPQNTESSSTVSVEEIPDSGLETARSEEGLRATYDALVNEDFRLTVLKNAAPRPGLSAFSNKSIEEIQVILESYKDLKRATLLAPMIVEAASKYKIPKVGFPWSLLSPSASPSGRIANKMAPDTANNVEKIAIGKIRQVVQLTLLRENEMSAEEKNYWQNVNTLLSASK